jgi:hypothetical protein
LSELLTFIDYLGLHPLWYNDFHLPN